MHEIARRTFLTNIAASSLVVATPSFAITKNTDGWFTLRAQQTSKKLAGDKYKPSDLYLYNAETPGPEIRVKQGEKVKVKFINELDEPTSIHWHGIRIDNNMDGVTGLTQGPVLPGESFDYEFTVPDSGTFWYHAHHQSWQQVARGLYGPLIVEEEENQFDTDHDLTLVIDDWRLAENGALDLSSLGAFSDWVHAGRLGNWLTVNGQSIPTFRINEDENYRIRLINACNARVLNIEPERFGAKLIGFDGFNFDAVRAHKKILAIAPAQRVDLLLNTRFTKTEQNLPLAIISGQQDLEIAKFEQVETSSPMTRPFKLSQNKITAPNLKEAKRYPLVMTGGAMGQIGEMTYKGERLSNDQIRKTKQAWAFNGIANLAKEPFLKAAQGESILLEIDNQTSWTHAMHVHGHHFQLISKDQNRFEKPDWRDTFLIERGEKAEIAFVADNPGKWLIHCHMLEHAASGMRTWFKVI